MKLQDDVKVQDGRAMHAPGTPRTLVWLAVMGAFAALHAGTAHAGEWTLAKDWTVSLDSTVSSGVTVRTSTPDCRFIGNDNGGCNGDAATPLQSSNPAVFSSSLDLLRLNQDDGNLNFRRGRVASANVQYTADLFVKGSAGWSALLRGVVNHDFAADRTRRTALDPEAKDVATSDPRWLDAYITKEFEIGEQQTRVRVGNQVLSWGENMYITGGIDSINPIYLPAAHQPGTPLKNLFIPSPMLSVSTSLGRGLGIEAFYQWKWNGFVVDAPGTFFSTADFAGRGARGLYLPTSVLNGVMSSFGLQGFPNGTIGDSGTLISGANPATGMPYNRRLAFNELADPGANPAGPLTGTGTVIGRIADREPKHDGQGGLALRYKLPESGNELGLYYYRYSDKLPFLSYQVASTTANLFGWEAMLDYGKKRDLFGASYNFQAGEWVVGTELSYRPRDGVSIDPTAVIDPANPYYCNALADFSVKPAGSYCRGWVDTKHVQFHLTGLHILSPSGSLGGVLRVLGASEGTLTAETALAHYPKLALDAGVPYAVTADYHLPTKTSWGMVLAGSVTYPNVFGTRASLSPDIAISQGISGYSATALPGFVKGAGSAVIGATIDFKVRPETKMRIDFTRNWGGGASNLMRDRNFMTASLSTSF